MSLHPAALRIIREVEELSGRPVHVREDADLRVLATVSPARGAAPAHFLSYRPGTQAVDYLVACQLGFLVRLYSCPAEERREVMALPHEQQEHSVRSQLAENARALAPETRQKFPKPLLDANTAMYAAYAELWGGILGDPRFSIPYKALGYGARRRRCLPCCARCPTIRCRSEEGLCPRLHLPKKCWKIQKWTETVFFCIR